MAESEPRMTVVVHLMTDGARPSMAERRTTEKNSLDNVRDSRRFGCRTVDPVAMEIRPVFLLLPNHRLGTSCAQLRVDRIED